MLAATPHSSSLGLLATGTRVLLVDDHEPTLRAISALLECEFPNIIVVGSARNGGEALRLLAAVQPEVLVLDLDLGGEYGLDLMPQLRHQDKLATIILSASDDPTVRCRALQAGATDFISKLAPAADLVAAILAAGR